MSIFGKLDWLNVATVLATTTLGPLGPFVGMGIKIAQAAHDQSKAGGGPGLSGADKLALAQQEIITGAKAAQAAGVHIDPSAVNDEFMHVVSDIVDASKIVAQVKPSANVRAGDTQTLPAPSATAAPAASGAGEASQVGQSAQAAEPATTAAPAAQAAQDAGSDMPEPSIGH